MHLDRVCWHLDRAALGAQCFAALQGNARNIVTVEQHLHDIMARLLEGQAKYLSSAGEYQLNPHWTPPPSALLPVVEAAALAGSAPAAAPRAVAAQ